MRTLEFNKKFLITSILAFSTIEACYSEEKLIVHRVMRDVQSGSADVETLRHDLEILKRENPHLYMRMKRAQEQDGAIRYSRGTVEKPQHESISPP